MTILISAPEDLDNIRNNLSGDYELNNDIDLSSWGNWTPIENFAGTINGKGYVIKNLTISDAPYAGFIGRTTSPFTVKNLGFRNININSKHYNAGALVSYTNAVNVLIQSCFVEGGSIYARGYAGGLIGNLRGDATVKDCYAIMDSIYTTQYRSSGFIGIIYGDAHNVKNCYAVTKSLDSADKSEIYGFTYSTANSTVENCYWDREVSAVTGSSFGIGFTTAEMKKQSTYIDWDFENIWGINGDYPYLRVFGVPPTPARKETITLNSYVNEITGKSIKQIKSTKHLQIFIESIQTNTERCTATLKKLNTFLSKIQSNVVSSHRKVETGKRNVYSFVLPIDTNIYKNKKSIKLLYSNIEPIISRTDVLYHSRGLPTYAVVSALENHSEVSNEQNITNSYFIENPSSSEVI